MELRDIIIKGSRKIYRKISGANFAAPDSELDRQKANDMITAVLNEDGGKMIARLGTTECGIVTNYLAVHNPASFPKRCTDFVFGHHGLPWWDHLFVEKMKWASGIFPQSVDILERFSERYLEDIPLMDVIGSFNITEDLLPIRDDVVRVHLECLYPFFVERPWTKVLEGKKVLAVHPFTDTIVKQHKKRKFLFPGTEIYPDFELLTLRAVQSGAGAETPFADWFEALKWMEDEVDKLDFDFAIIGCGAYGLPLAAHIKRIGKKAIHLAGGSQLLFGIKGKRWDNDNYHWEQYPQLNTSYCNLYNEHWTRPNQSETPKAATIVEGGCYW